MVRQKVMIKVMSKQGQLYFLGHGLDPLFELVQSPFSPPLAAPLHRSNGDGSN